MIGIADMFSIGDVFSGDQLEVTRAVARWGIINTIVWSLGFLATCIMLFLTRRTIRNTSSAHAFSKIMDHNKMIYDDPKKQQAVDIFRNLSVYGSDHDLYWAARAIHLNHINLVAQAWILSGSTERGFKRRFPGWIALARSTAVELENAKRGTKPSWYKAACADLYPLDKDILYDQKFVSWFNSLSKPLDGEV